MLLQIQKNGFNTRILSNHDHEPDGIYDLLFIYLHYDPLVHKQHGEKLFKDNELQLRTLFKAINYS